MAQLCLQILELIARRDNLFHLARHVVKMAEEIQDDNFLLSNPDLSKEDQSMLGKLPLDDIEKQIIDIDTLNQLNNKFAEQTSSATKRMLLKAGSLLCHAS